MIRKIIKINQEKCNGCGACAVACHEGAIEMKNGKAQLTREEKKGQQQTAPRMSSLRESGQIEQDADVIMMLYRLNPNDPDSERRLKLAKNKEGRIGYVDLQFIGAQQSFVEQMPPMKLPPLPKRPKPPKDPQMSLSDAPVTNPEPLGEEGES